MNLDDVTKFKLQSHANRLLSLEYDGSGDWWHYVEVLGKEYGINIWDADEYGDGEHSGLRITVYPTNEVTGDTIFEQYESLKTEELPLKIFKLRRKVKNAVSSN